MKTRLIAGLRKNLGVCMLISIGLALLIIQTVLNIESKSHYYGVFLNNGQVYFGHIEYADSTMLVLKNVYYLRTNTNLTTEALKQTKNDVNLHLSLVKLGNEIHQPEDSMYINREQVLFWEQLRDDSYLVKAVKKYPSN